jgi:hypothetical protein
VCGKQTKQDARRSLVQVELSGKFLNRCRSVVKGSEDAGIVGSNDSAVICAGQKHVPNPGIIGGGGLVSGHSWFLL